MGNLHGVVTMGDFRKQRAGRPCSIAADREGLPVGGPGARSPRATRRDAEFRGSGRPGFRYTPSRLAKVLTQPCPCGGMAAECQP